MSQANQDGGSYTDVPFASSGGYFTWINPGFIDASYERNIWWMANYGVDEASAYADIEWYLTRGNIPHMITLVATVQFEHVDGNPTHVETLETLQTSVTLDLYPPPPPPPPGGGGGCPDLLVWDGTGFVNEGVLNLHNLVNPESDITVFHTLTTMPALNHQVCSIRLAEDRRSVQQQPLVDRPGQALRR